MSRMTFKIVGFLIEGHSSYLQLPVLFYVHQVGGKNKTKERRGYSSN